MRTDEIVDRLAALITDIQKPVPEVPILEDSIDDEGKAETVVGVKVRDLERFLAMAKFWNERRSADGIKQPNWLPWMIARYAEAVLYIREEEARTSVEARFSQSAQVRADE